MTFDEPPSVTFITFLGASLIGAGIDFYTSLFTIPVDDISYLPILMVCVLWIFAGIFFTYVGMRVEEIQKTASLAGDSTSLATSSIVGQWKSKILLKLLLVISIILALGGLFISMIVLLL